MAKTLKDVAKLAKVGISTASYVVNGTGLSKVSPKTQQTILRAAAKLDYRPNLMARGLRTRKSNSLGIIFRTNADRYHGELVGDMQTYISQLGYTGIFAFNHCGSIGMKEVCRTILGHHVDGVITCAYRPEWFPAELPVLHFANTSAVSPDVDAVTIDYTHAVHAAMDHFAGHGHGKIGYVGSFGDDRFRVYRSYLEQHALPFRAEWIFEGWGTSATGEAGAQRILAAKERPTAIMAFNDTVAISVINAAHRLGLSVPGDLSVIGFDNIEEAAYEFPRLTTCDTRISDTSHLLIDTLLARMKNPRAKVRVLTVRPELLVRESCAPPRGGTAGVGGKRTTAAGPRRRSRERHPE